MFIRRTYVIQFLNLAESSKLNDQINNAGGGLFTSLSEAPLNASIYIGLSGFNDEDINKKALNWHRQVCENWRNLNFHAAPLSEVIERDDQAYYRPVSLN